MTSADRIWNRGALEAGGDSPGPGDRALASLLLVHGLVMNGGVHHAIECVEPVELAAAADGYAFFGFDDVAEFFRGASADPVLSTRDDDTEVVANRRYAEMVPDDSHLVARFEEVFVNNLSSLHHSDLHRWPPNNRLQQTVRCAARR